MPKTQKGKFLNENADPREIVILMVWSYSGINLAFKFLIC